MIGIRQFHHARGISQQLPQQGSYANCLVAHETMEKVITIKSEAYVTTLKKICKCTMQVQLHQKMNDVLLLHNKAAQQSENKKMMAKPCWIVLPHTPNSLVLSPPDFHCFGPTKNAIHGRKFREDKVIKGVKIWLQ
jgi:hypothetical protein